MATVEGMFVGGFITDGTTISVFLFGIVVLFWFPSIPYRFLYVFFSSVSLLVVIDVSRVRFSAAGRKLTVSCAWMTRKSRSMVKEVR